MKRVATMTIAVLACVLICPVAADQVTVMPTDLGTFGGANSVAEAVNGGVVVGWSQKGDGDTDAFAYDVASKTMTDLGTLGGSMAFAEAVDGGVVVGASQLADNTWELFKYDLNAGSPHMVELYLGGPLVSLHVEAFRGGVIVGQAGSNRAYAYDLNPGGGAYNLGTFCAACPTLDYSGANDVSNGVVVGWATDSHQHNRAFEYDLNAASPQLVDLGTLGGSKASAAAIDGDVIAGSSTLAGDTVMHAFSYDRLAHHMTDLGTLGGTDSHAVAMDGGVIVGQSDTAGDAGSHAFVYDLATKEMTDLGTLGGTQSEATAVRGGVVVGWSQVATGTAWHGFAYDLKAASPQMIDLGSLGGSATGAKATDGTLVVGYAELTGSAGSHAAVWKLAAETVTTIDSSPNPSVVGGQVTYTATVAPAPNGGTVAFMEGSGAIAGCASQLVDTSSGVATCQVTYSAPGSDTIKAIYSGAAGFPPSTSADWIQNVGYTVRSESKPKASQSGASVPIKLQLFDANNNNVSSPSIVATVTKLDPSPAPGSPPSGTFTYVILESGPGYQFIVKTKNYPPGTYTLYFTVAGDPTTHTASFVIG